MTTGPDPRSGAEYIIYYKGTAAEATTFAKKNAKDTRFMTARILILGRLFVSEDQLKAALDVWETPEGAFAIEVYKDTGKSVGNFWRRQRFTSTRATIDGLENLSDRECTAMMNRVVKHIRIVEPCIERYVKGDERGRVLGITCKTPSDLKSFVSSLDKMKFNLRDGTYTKVKITPIFGELTVNPGFTAKALVGETTEKKPPGVTTGSGSTWAMGFHQALAAAATGAPSGEAALVDSGKGAGDDDQSAIAVDITPIGKPEENPHGLRGRRGADRPGNN